MATDFFWGVDSVTPANHVMGLKGKPTLFQYITDHCGRMPDFWGRYVGGKYAIKPAEADYIFDASGGDCRILLAYNGATNSHVSTQGGYKQGQHDAAKAAAGAKHAKVPGGVMIYADVEPGWKCTVDWFRGWWDGMYNSPYAGMGGVYENPLPWNANHFTKPYIKALKGDSPFIYQDPPAKARYLWSQQGQKGPIKPNDAKFGELSFAPAEPDGLPGVTVLWQYAIDCFKLHGSKWGLVDLDLADARGYDLMWASDTGQGILV